MQKVSYMGDGVNTEFTFNFPYFENSNVVVTKNGVSATGYNIIGNSGGLDADYPFIGGTVVFDVAPTALDSITIARNLPLSRIVDYQQTSILKPKELNQDANYLMELLKDLTDEIAGLRADYAAILNSESAQEIINKIDAANTQITQLNNDTQDIGGIAGISSNITNLNSQITNKLNTTFDNISDDAKIASVSWGRQFTNVGATIAEGNAGIAGSYNLSQYLNNDTTRVKMGLFSVRLNTTQSGFSSIGLKTDEMTNATVVCGTNNSFSSHGSIFLPFRTSIALSFPSASAGINSNTNLTFIGYM